MSNKQEQEQLQQQMNRSTNLIEELNTLKGRYFRLTDTDYDKLQNRRLPTRRASKTTTTTTTNNNISGDLPKGTSYDDLNNTHANMNPNPNSSQSTPAAMNTTKSLTLIAGHMPMTPAAKSLRHIQPPNSGIERAKSPPISASSLASASAPVSASLSSLAYTSNTNNKTVAGEIAVVPAEDRSPITYHSRHCPPHWTIIR
jgi:hypothetical protein